MRVISVKEEPKYLEEALQYVQEKWASKESMLLYQDCFLNMCNTDSPLPQWYILKDKDTSIGCAGLITNDFISRMDLYPWLCALYIEDTYRGHHYGKLLIDKAMLDCQNAGFKYLYLCTDHIGYYEKYGFEYLGDGYHPWGEKSRIYSIAV